MNEGVGCSGDWRVWQQPKVIEIFSGDLNESLEPTHSSRITSSPRSFSYVAELKGKRTMLKSVSKFLALLARDCLR